MNERRRAIVSIDARQFERHVDALRVARAHREFPFHRLPVDRRFARVGGNREGDDISFRAHVRERQVVDVVGRVAERAGQIAGCILREIDGDDDVRRRRVNDSFPMTGRIDVVLCGE